MFDILSDVAEFTDDATVVIVDDNTPPTLFTVGKSAVPPRSFANLNLPFVTASASRVIEPPTFAATKAVVAICVELLDGSAVIAVGVPVKAGLVDNTTDPVPVAVYVPVPPLVMANGVVKLKVPDDIAVVVIVPAAKLPAPSLLTIVFDVLSDVAELTDDATVVIVDESTPPTLFTIGSSAVPPKSFANFIIPFALVVASVADIVPEAIVIPAPAVKAPCFALKDAYSALLNNPAVVPISDAKGIVSEIVGVVFPLATVDVKVLPLAFTIIGFTLVTVPIPPDPASTDIAIEPLPFVIDTPLPPVKVAFVKVFPSEFPINN